MHLMTHVLILIVLIGAIKWVRANRCARATANAAPAFGPEPGNGRAGAMRDEVGALKDRIATLERIAVDGRSSAALAAEIDSLRD